MSTREKVTQTLAPYIQGSPGEGEWVAGVADRVIAAYEAALGLQEGGPNVVAPREPTEAMLTAGHAAGVQPNMLWTLIADLDERLAVRLRSEYLPAAYRAMITARDKRDG